MAQHLVLKQLNLPTPYLAGPTASKQHKAILTRNVPIPLFLLDYYILYMCSYRFRLMR